MFMEIAIGAIGIGIVLMVGYLVVAQVKSALPVSYYSYYNSSGSLLTTQDLNVTNGLSSTQTTVFAGFGLVAVGIIVLAAFGLINVFR